MRIYIRNMACESCKIVVQEALQKIGVHAKKVELGEAELDEKLTPEQQQQLNAGIKKAGLELIENKEGILLEKIRKVILEYVFHPKEKMPKNFSRYLGKQLNYSYPYLAAFFSSMQATTIERYIISLRIEKAKEYILFNEYTLTEIAYKLNYSSVAHLSGQFKKVTGLTPSHFKKLRNQRRIVLQQL
jgi:copper chaperone CopZ